MFGAGQVRAHLPKITKEFIPLPGSENLTMLPIIKPPFGCSTRRGQWQSLVPTRREATAQRKAITEGQVSKVTSEFSPILKRLNQSLFFALFYITKTAGEGFSLVRDKKQRYTEYQPKNQQEKTLISYFHTNKHLKTGLHLEEHVLCSELFENVTERFLKAIHFFSQKIVKSENEKPHPPALGDSENTQVLSSSFLSILTMKARVMCSRGTIFVSWLFGFFFSSQFLIYLWLLAFLGIPHLAQLSYFPICSYTFLFFIFAHVTLHRR